MDISEELKSIVNKLKMEFGYELTRVSKEDDVDIDHLLFERATPEGNHQKLIIEDHTWERFLPDFDPEHHPWEVGDWLIFSYLTDDVRDWFGRYTETQHPLTYTEYRLIDRLIRQIEKERRYPEDRIFERKIQQIAKENDELKGEKNNG